MTDVIYHTFVHEGVRANYKGKIKYVLGKILPRIFGTPMEVAIILTGPDGRIKDRRRIWNTVTTNGKNGIADNLLASPTLGKPTHMAIGTGTPAANALGSELDRNALTSKTRSNAVVTMVGDWAAGDGTGALTEAGMFNAASAGNLWLSTSFAVINKGANDTLQIVWTLGII